MKFKRLSIWLTIVINSHHTTVVQLNKSKCQIMVFRDGYFRINLSIFITGTRRNKHSLNIEFWKINEKQIPKWRIFIDFYHFFFVLYMWNSFLIFWQQYYQKEQNYHLSQTIRYIIILLYSIAYSMRSIIIFRIWLSRLSEWCSDYYNVVAVMFILNKWIVAFLLN